MKDAKNLICAQCLVSECQYSLTRNYVGECSQCGDGGYDPRVADPEHKKAQKAKQPAKSAPSDPNEIVITIDDIDEPEEPKELDRRQKREQSEFNRNVNNNREHLQHKLYLDHFSTGNAQIMCTGCQFVANLPNGKASVSEKTCAKCGRHMIKLATKTGELEQCAFCEMQGVEFTESKFVHSDLRGHFKGKGGPRGKGGHGKGHGGHRGPPAHK